MRTMLFFLRDAHRNPVLQAMYGQYGLCGFFMVHDTGKTELFCTMAGTTFKWLIEIDRTRTDFLLLPLDKETSQKVYDTCVAIVRSRVKFNLKDLLLMHVPFREVVDTPLFECETLNNVQCIILLLRECLPKEHALQAVLRSLHSRQTLAEDLYNNLHPFSDAVQCLEKFLRPLDEHTPPDGAPALKG